jgi:hypothetical protein
MRKIWAGLATNIEESENEWTNSISKRLRAMYKPCGVSVAALAHK